MIKKNNREFRSADNSLATQRQFSPFLDFSILKTYVWTPELLHS